MSGETKQTRQPFKQTQQKAQDVTKCILKVHPKIKNTNFSSYL